MHKFKLLALPALFASTVVLAQAPVQSPSSAGVAGQSAQIVQRHPQAGCLGAIRRELGDYAGAVNQGLQTGRIDPNRRAGLEKILAELTALEASARADNNLTGDACKSLYKRIEAENSGIQITMRAHPYAAPTTGGASVTGK